MNFANKLILSSVAILFLSIFSFAQEAPKGFKKYGIIEFPHILKAAVDRIDSLELDKKQNDVLYSMVLENQNTLKPMIQSSNKLEYKIKKALIKEGKTKEQVESDFKELIAIKTKISEYQMNAIDKMKTTLSKEQWDGLIEAVHNKGFK